MKTFFQVKTLKGKMKDIGFVETKNCLPILCLQRFIKILSAIRKEKVFVDEISSRCYKK